MSVSSQTPAFATDAVVVTFDPSVHLQPLTASAKSVADDVERYLQRSVPGRLTATVDGDAGRGLVLRDGRLFATFEFASLGGAV